MKRPWISESEDSSGRSHRRMSPSIEINAPGGIRRLLNGYEAVDLRDVSTPVVVKGDSFVKREVLLHLGSNFSFEEFDSIYDTSTEVRKDGKSSLVISKRQLQEPEEIEEAEELVRDLLVEESAFELWVNPMVEVEATGCNDLQINNVAHPKVAQLDGKLEVAKAKHLELEAGCFGGNPGDIRAVIEQTKAVSGLFMSGTFSCENDSDTELALEFGDNKEPNYARKAWKFEEYEPKKRLERDHGDFGF